MTRTLTLLIVFILSSPAIVLGQDAKLEGYVHDEKGRALVEATVAIPGGEETTTDSEGHFQVSFPSTAKLGEPVKIVIIKDDWVVFTPMFGKYVIQNMKFNSEPLPITVVKRGSPRFLERARFGLIVGEIETRTSLAVNLNGGVNHAEQQRNNVLQEYAEDSGIPVSKLEAALDEWAKIVQAETDEEAGRQAYWRRDYRKSAELLRKSARDDTEQKQQSEALLTTHRTRISRYLGAANSSYVDDDPEEALFTLLELDHKFETGEFVKSQSEFQWAELRLFIGKSKIELGSKVSGSRSHELFNEAFDECQKAMSVYTPQAFPARWARTRQIEFWALFRKGERITGAAGLDLLNKSAAALRAIETHTEFTDSLAKATVQQGLGLVLVELSARTADRKERLRLLDDAAAAYKRAGEVFTREADPEAWASLQSNMGIVYLSLSNEVDEKQAIDYLRKAREGYSQTITINSRQHPLSNWASDQSNLGIVLNALSRRSQGAERTKLLNDSITAYKEALKYYLPTKTPQDWARTQNGLSNALKELSKHSDPPQEKEYLNQAVVGFNEILKILTKDSFPLLWAHAQNNLGNGLLQLSGSVTGAERVEYLTKATSSYKKALEVYDPVFSAVLWADSWTNIGITVGLLARESVGAERLKNFQAAIDAFETALKARNFDKLSMSWATTQLSLSHVLQTVADETDGETQLTYLRQAETAIRNAGQLYTEETFPTSWADQQHSLGRICERLFRHATGEQKFKYLRESEVALRNALRIYLQDPSTHEWIASQIDLGGTLYELGMYVDDSERSKYLTEAVELYRRALATGNRGAFPPNWEGTYATLGNALQMLSRSANGKQVTEFLEQAVLAYQDGLQLRAKGTREWGELKHSLGNTLLNLSTLTNDEKKLEYLKKSEAAFRFALEYYSQEREADEWADIQFRLASVLFEIGIRTESNAQLTYLRDAEAAYEAALRVFTPEHSLSPWSHTQLNLGLTRFYLGELAQGEQRTTYFKQAELAFQQASQFFNREEWLDSWTMIHRYLGRCYLNLEKWNQASNAYSLLLKYDSNDQEAYQIKSHVDHDKLYDFVGVFDLTQRWLASHPNDLDARVSFAENHFTTGRFSECEQLILALLTESKVSVRMKVALRAIRIASLLANGRNNQVLPEIDSLIEDVRSQQAEFRVAWRFDGATQFMNQEKTLARHRDWLRLLFDALEESQNRDILLKALHAIRSSFIEP